jgi:nucleoside-diphosphate-sugar epimerase
MRVLVTDNFLYIGRVLAPMILQAGHKVVNTDLLKGCTAVTSGKTTREGQPASNRQARRNHAAVKAALPHCVGAGCQPCRVPTIGIQ